jgi:large subunit GTPase 1
MTGQYVTREKEDAAWVKMRSITEQSALDEFLTTAELAGTDFTAEKMNSFKIIHTDQRNPYLLSAAEERAALQKHDANRRRLTIPRRPPWDETTTPDQLNELESASFLQWRRGLAELEEAGDVLLTPYEHNIEVWRQLWRVIERSDLIVQIVDARNPLLFRSEDLERYVKEVDGKKNNLLLVNKADMLTVEQRRLWADYFDQAGVRFQFFSAELAKEMILAQAKEEGESDASEGDNSEPDESEDGEDDEEDMSSDDDESQRSTEEPSHLVPRGTDERTRILTTEELEALFLHHAPTPSSSERKIQVGLVGYPNVGKSSTINALVGAKKVSVSSTPGKTKHFQTIILSPEITLCDCPGLVFPNFATTKAELVCNGVLPIDQQREFTGPAGLVARRIPRELLERIYGMKMYLRPLEEGGTGVPTGIEVLKAYARARGFFRAGLGQPDESRAARYILKDYVKGKLLYCHPPPSESGIDSKDFNQTIWEDEGDEAEVPLQTGEAGSVATTAAEPAPTPLPVRLGSKSARLDKTFFTSGQGSAGHLRMPFQYKYSEQGRKQLSDRKQRTLLALEKDVDASELGAGGKKHFKANKKRVRSKSGRGDTDD